jgi:hypothetical protein
VEDQEALKAVITLLESAKLDTEKADKIIERFRLLLVKAATNVFFVFFIFLFCEAFEFGLRFDWMALSWAYRDGYQIGE